MELVKNLKDEVSIPAIASSTGKQFLVYFIPGNPGLVEYYRLFLEQLHAALPAPSRNHVTIYGASHDGFEVHPDSLLTTEHGHGPPFSLDEVIEGTKRKIVAKVKDLQSQDGKGTDEEPVQVILIGHSVGTYIIMEIVTWWQEQQRQKSGLSQRQEDFSIIGGMLLFPTIVDIVKSEQGKVFKHILKIPFLAIIAQFLAAILSHIPTAVWDWAKFMTPGEHLPEQIAVTEAMVRSPHGPRQGIHMAKDEMTAIAEDKWHPTNLWGVLPHSQQLSTASESVQNLIDVSETEMLGKDADDRSKALRTKLFFYWGEDDYWVDNKVRDALIAKRAKREGDVETRHWPEMVIEREGMDHCFSLNRQHSQIVAEQVAQWVESVMKGA